MTKFSSFLSTLLGLVVISVGGMAAPSSAFSGNLSGLMLDEAGLPISDLIVSVFETSAEESLPTLAKTNRSGRVFIKDLRAGTYQISVKSPDYRSPVKRLVEVLPGRTAVVTLVLEGLLSLRESGSENFSVKSILRDSEAERLIFRELPGFEEEFEVKAGILPLFEEAVFEVFSGSGFGGDFVALPGDPWSGTSSNFAASHSISGRTDYTFAAQMNSGSDSLWRFKNVLTRRLGEQNSAELVFGYGRLSFSEPSLSLLSNPTQISDEVGYTTAPANGGLVTLALRDTWQVDTGLSVAFGFELNQLYAGRRETFLSPNAEVLYRPFSRTEVAAGVFSKRSTHGNTVTLPNGGQVNLGDSLVLSRLDDEFVASGVRYYNGRVTQSLNDNTQLEVAFFESAVVGEGLPILAVFEVDSSSRFLRLDDGLSGSQGYRVTFRRGVGENLRGEVSFVSGLGAGVVESRSALVDSPEILAHAVARQRFHQLVTQFEAKIPKSGTKVTALLKIVPAGRPISTIDSFVDRYEAGNEGLNLFVRQIIPIPSGLLTLLGLNFLAPEEVEALLDVRNLTDSDLGVIESEEGNIALIRNPRTLRGGIAFKF